MFDREYLIRAVLISILLFGLIFKIIYLFSYASDSPYYAKAYMDSAVYADWAKLINHEGWLGKEVFYWAPFYPYFLSVLFSIFPNKFLFVYIVQLVLGICTVGLIYLTGKAIYNERTGLIAASFSLLYAPFTFFETKILPSVTGVFLGTLFIYLLTKAEREKNCLYWLLGATVLGFAITCRPNYLLVSPIMIVGLFVVYRKQLKQTYLPILIVTVMPLLIVGVVTLRNYAVGHDFVLISSNGGVTFAQGNNPWARGSMVILPGFSGLINNQKQEETIIAEAEVGRELRPSEVNRFWFKWGLKFIGENPLRYLGLLINKVALTVSSFELGSNYLLSIDRAVTPWLKLACLPFGLILAFAGAGIVALFSEKRPALIVLSTFICGFIILLLFYVNTRYRMALVPATIIMAGGGFDYLLRSLKRPNIAFLIAALIFILSLPPFMPLDKQGLAETHGDYWAHLGRSYRLENKLDKSLWAYEKAISMNPTNYTYYLEKIETLAASSSPDEEIKRWVESVAPNIGPDPYRKLFLGEAYFILGDNLKSQGIIQDLLSSNKEDYKIYLKLGVFYGKTGRHLQAKEILAKGLELKPENTDLQFNYALACFHLGEKELSIRYANRIIAAVPYHRRARLLLEQMENKQ